MHISAVSFSSCVSSCSIPVRIPKKPVVIVVVAVTVVVAAVVVVVIVVVAAVVFCCGCFEIPLCELTYWLVVSVEVAALAWI